MEELKENCDWAPLTPAKPDPNFNVGDKTLIHDVKNPQCPQIWGKLGQKEKESGDINFKFGNFVNEVGGQCSVSGEDNLGLHGQSKGVNDNENLNYGFRLHSKKASTLPNNPTPRKRRKVNNGVDLTPRKRVRMKRHRPKVFDETKPKKPSTPNLRTPKRSARYQKKKVNLKASIELLNNDIKEAIYEAIKPSCRRELNFDVEKDKPEVEQNLQLGSSNLSLEKDIVNVCDGVGDKREPNLQLGGSNLSLEKDILNVCDGIGDESKLRPNRLLDSSSLRVYKRIFRPNECLKNSRKIGPNCPTMFKKRRTRRIRATSLVKFDFLKKSDEGPKMCDNFTMKLRSRKRKTSSVNVSKEKINTSSVSVSKEKINTSSINVSKEKINTSSVSVSEKKINWTVYLTRKRSNTSTQRRDFSSLGIDDSKIEVSEEFLLKASRIRTKVNAKFAARVEIQDKGIQKSVTENSMGQQELDKGIQNSITESSMGQQELIEDQTVLEIDHQVVKDQNVLFENKVQFIDSEFSQGVKVKVKCTKKTLESSDSVKPDLAGPNHKQKDAYDDAFIEALVNYACKKMECLNIDDKFNEIVVRDVNGENVIVPYKGIFDISKLRKPAPKVDLDPETMRVWNMLMENSGPDDNEQEEDIEDKSNYWKEQHELYRGRVDSFIARMHQIQGDRRFSPWKGSVVDSVIGVFLTQNVSDHLSSSAFMSLAAKFPPEHVIRENDTQNVRVEIPESPPCKCNEPETLSILENDTQNVRVEIPKTPPSKCNEPETSESYPSPSPKNVIALKPENGNKTPSQTEPTPRRKKGNVKVKQENTIDWDELRKTYSRGGPKRSIETADTVNWEAVRKARLRDVAEVIAERGMNNLLAGRIKDFLNRIVKDHGSIDLEWLRDVPPDKAKDYLLSIPGLGLKSVECVRLLTLHHHAFPVDVNVGRILVRLGWVPLKPLPEDVQIHLLNQYPVLDSIQQYIWPRLCVRDQPTLYEAHYQMITFGKAFCTKRQPNCNACPMRGECKHFASAYASSKLLIGGPQGENPTTDPSPVSSCQDPTAHNNPPFLLSNSSGDPSDVMYNICNIEPIIEIPPSPEPLETQEIDIEEIDHYNYGSDDEIPVIDLNGEEFKKNVLKVVEENNLLCSEGDMSKALVTLRPEHASIPIPKLKTVGRLKTQHQVYELPDSHPLLAGFEEREPDDPCPYLLAIWATADESTDSFQEAGKVCENDQTVRGTILIPCRTANRGSFPLNGTYFQVNEVFAEHESSRNPIAVPREWIWNLKRRTLYCGTSVQSISRGYSMEEIAYCFRHGFICVRGFDTVIRRAKSLATRFHLCKTRPIDNE